MKLSVKTKKWVVVSVLSCLSILSYGRTDSPPDVAIHVTSEAGERVVIGWSSEDVFSQICGMGVDSFSVTFPKGKVPGEITIQTSVQKNVRCVQSLGKESGSIELPVGFTAPNLTTSGVYQVQVNGKIRGEMSLEISEDFKGDGLVKGIRAMNFKLAPSHEYPGT